MSPIDRIRVLVIHGDAVSSAGLMAIFRKYPEFEIVNADDDPEGERVLHQSPARWQADIVVADYEHGIDLAARIAAYPASAVTCKVMIVAQKDREWDIRHALEVGVRGYLLVGCALTELAVGVRTIHRGLRHLSSAVSQRLAESLSAESLTPREETVLQLVVDGLGNKAIARQLDITVGTVKSHVKGVFSKLNVESRTQAMAATERRGLLCDTQRGEQLNGDKDKALHSTATLISLPTFVPNRRMEPNMAARKTSRNTAVCMN